MIVELGSTSKLTSWQSLLMVGGGGRISSNSTYSNFSIFLSVIAFSAGKGKHLSTNEEFIPDIGS